MVDLFFSAGVNSGVQNANEDPETLRFCPNFTDQACLGATQLNTTGYPDEAVAALMTSPTQPSTIGLPVVGKLAF